MNNRKTAQIAAAILCAISTMPTLSADPASSTRGPVRFESYDADRNGNVSPDEFDRMRSERIRSRSMEHRQLRNMANAPAFADIDQNNDGNLNREEVQARQRIRHQNQYRMNGQTGSGYGMGSGRGGMSGGGGTGGRW